MVWPRDIIERIEPFLKRTEFIAIVGPRQSGKTTLLEILKSHLVKERKVILSSIAGATFEDRRLLTQFETDPVGFVKSYMSKEASGIFYLMIDEFQYASGGGQKLKLIYDTVKNLKIIITGSSSLDIKAEVGRFMVGRILTFHLFPFNFGESLKAHDVRLEKIYRQNNQTALKLIFSANAVKLKRGADVFHEEMLKLYERFCIWGGYPAVALSESDSERKKLLADIYNNYILKDIKTLLELATENNLYLLSQYLATQIGNIVVYQNLSQASGLNYRNLKKHLNILKETFICEEIKPFFKNRQKELSKNPKVFFYDMGFRNNLIDNMNSLDKRTDKGAMVENAVFIRLNELCEEAGRIRFWRTKAGAEVDFVLRVGGDNVPIEVKYSVFSAEKISKSLASFIEHFKPERAVVLTKNHWAITRKDKTKILFMPVYYL